MCPIILATTSIETLLVRVTVVANVYRAVCEEICLSIPHRAAISFKYSSTVERFLTGSNCSSPLYLSKIIFGIGSNGTRNGTPVFTLLFLIHSLPHSSPTICSFVNVFRSLYDNPV